MQRSELGTSLIRESDSPTSSWVELHASIVKLVSDEATASVLLVRAPAVLVGTDPVAVERSQA
jgi:hypothetical protein